MSDRTLGCLGLVGVALFFAAVVGLGLYDNHVKRACLQAGYPGGDYSWTLTAYCIKRVNQTDVVIPLSEIH